VVLQLHVVVPTWQSGKWISLVAPNSQYPLKWRFRSCQVAHFHGIVHAVVPAHGFLLIAGVVPEQLQDVKTRRAEAVGPAAVVRTGG
jgi:hypothetical protein